MKNYVFVEFSSGQSDVVLKNWMVGEKKCRWPPLGSDVRNMVKNNSTYENDWTLWDCNILCQASK